MTGIDRRRFLGSLGAAAAAGSVPRPIKAALLPTDWRQVRGSPRVAVLAQSGFPTIDTQPLTDTVLTEALAGFDTTALGVEELDKLTPDAFDVFLNPYGSAFPKRMWPQLSAYLDAGGNWVNVGGVPFAVPVREEGGAWQPEARQTAYHKRLGITQAFPVDTAKLDDYRPNPQVEFATLLTGQAVAPTTYELYYRFTREKEYPDEDGSDGTREAVVEPLVSIYGRGEHPVAAPIVRIDRLRGPYAGGRWILANLDGSVSGEALIALIHDAATGAFRFTAKPTLACYRDGESPVIVVALKSPGSDGRKSAVCRIAVFDEDEVRIAETTISLRDSGFAVSASARLRSEGGGGLDPGLYRVETKLESDEAAIDGLSATTGFWMFDQALLSSGEPFTTDETSLLRNGAPYIATGTSYMATDVHRRFLLEPNPAVWDDDFAAMKRAGVNMIRTGIWTGWRNYMPEPGEFSQIPLRALDAFLLIAHKYDIPVIFTFFAFIPPAWGGENPYLDPRAVEAQKTFLTLIAERYRDARDIIWDLINEPSFCSPERLWVTRPNYDQHEERAWHEWLRRRYEANSDDELRQILAEKWRTLPEDAMDLPRLEEFGDRNIFESVRPLKAMDYRLFANEMFARWAKELADTLHEAGSPAQLVTVGQDEGGTYERPSPTFYGPSVAFTSNHTWWLNDDLLWDSIVTKTPDRPNLISETGIMFYEKIDGSAWRSEEDARDLLERKLALATAVGGAGWIEWIWNTNPYMPLDNEAAIGLLRPDGTAKPELGVLRDMAKFVAEAAPRLGPREPDPVVMVIPHSHMFSVRNFATEATQRCVRAMCYDCRVPMSAVSEYALERLRHRPKLIVVPSPRVLTEGAWQQLLKFAWDGATVLVSGPVDYDEHWLPAPRLDAFGVRAVTVALANEENLELNGETHRLSYRDLKIQRVEKAAVDGSALSRVHTVQVGRGSLIWSPLPLELAEQTGPAVTLYSYALAHASVEPPFSIRAPTRTALVYPALYRDAVLYAVVSEQSAPLMVDIQDIAADLKLQVSLDAGRAVLALVDRGGAGLLSRYGEVSVR